MTSELNGPFLDRTERAGGGKVSQITCQGTFGRYRDGAAYVAPENILHPEVLHAESQTLVPLLGLSSTGNRAMRQKNKTKTTEVCWWSTNTALPFNTPIPVSATGCGSLNISSHMKQPRWQNQLRVVPICLQLLGIFYSKVHQQFIWSPEGTNGISC